MPRKKLDEHLGAPRATRLIRAELNKFYAKPDPNAHLAAPRIWARTVGNAKAAIYAFYDYDGEPIYVGQTSASVSDRVGRHLTGQRSDAVAKFVLDPFEVADIEVWTLHSIAEMEAGVAKKRALLNAYEYSAYQKLRDRSTFKTILNEAVPTYDGEPVELPASARDRIIPADLWEDRKHSDIRIARRAAHVARLAQLISEREASNGLRRTLHLQTQRLEWLSNRRLEELGVPAEFIPGEPTELTNDD